MNTRKLCTEFSPEEKESFRNLVDALEAMPKDKRREIFGMINGAAMMALILAENGEKS